MKTFKQQHVWLERLNNNSTRKFQSSKSMPSLIKTNYQSPLNPVGKNVCNPLVR